MSYGDNFLVFFLLKNESRNFIGAIFTPGAHSSIEAVIAKQTILSKNRT